MKEFFSLLFLILSSIAFSQEKSVKVNGHSFNIYLKGFEQRKADSPVIIFENGMGMGLGNWDSIIDEMAKITPVFAYDRSGVGKSEKVFQLPTPKLVSENLKAILTTLNIPPPYVLVGHSMGGLYSRAFAGFYPNDMAGLVFIDPADFTESKQEWNSIFRTIGVPEKRIDEMLYNRLYKVSPIDSLNYGPWSEAKCWVLCDEPTLLKLAICLCQMFRFTFLLVVSLKSLWS